MTKGEPIHKEEIYRKIRLIANGLRFRILELTQNNQLSISELSSALKLSYTKCADYVKMLENLRLVTKTKSGKEVLVKSRVTIHADSLIFQ
jgi:predicted transcriptional regulator